MAHLTFADVMDDSILVYVEDHQAFLDWLEQQTGGGVGQTGVDLAKQQITYQPKLHKRDEVVARVHLLGSIAESPRSALWAWANPAFAEAPVAQMSTRVRDFGAARGIPELTTGELPIADQGGEEALTGWATRMAAVSCRIIGIPTAQVMTTGTTRVVMLVDAAGFTPPAPSGITFPRILTTALQADGWITDHRRAVQGYAQARNLPYGWEPGFAALNIGFPEGNVRVAFDEQGRVGAIDAQLGPAAGPATGAEQAPPPQQF
ncbi:DUF6882 domain-containing protein [Enemella evansiae]|uniref:DUF6882 domain-containing protein n=1 Tax=Enemella evansiae TaxID=2016499 RepID=UPI000B9668ED|nr:DUF6882 domain-containing protein [Enemella evansiae]OYO01836.1 hypothetical protein CGZ97_15560 [Enemella evansiae]